MMASIARLSTYDLAYCPRCRAITQVGATLLIQGRLFDIWRYTCAECGTRLWPQERPVV